MPMPARVIRRINAIGAQERQGREFRFLNRRNEPFEWSDEVQEDDPEFQGLLDENEETALYPDISAELPGVELEEDEQEFETVTTEPEPDFRQLAGVALHNAGIDAEGALRRARENNVPQGTMPVEDGDEEVVYEITFDLPDAGLLPNRVVPNDNDPEEPLGDGRDDTLVVAVPGADTEAVG